MTEAVSLGLSATDQEICVTPFDRFVIERLDALPGQQHWDVMPADGQAHLAVCGEYPTASAAAAALEAAGFGLTRFAVAVAQMNGRHDPQTILKFAGAEGSRLVLARRLGS